MCPNVTALRAHVRRFLSRKLHYLQQFKQKNPLLQSGNGCFYIKIRLWQDCWKINI